VSDVIALALALALGLLVGLGVGALRAFRIEARRRALAGGNAHLARFWPAELPARSAADILAGRVRVVLGGETYDLPVLPRAASRRWLETLDLRFAVLASDLEAAGNDTPVILGRLLSESDGLYEMLRSYDQGDALPPREEIDELVTDVEILRAVLEVWRAANPLAASLAETAPTTAGSSPASLSSPPPPTDGTQPSWTGA
jgi:hypothetical protein